MVFLTDQGLAEFVDGLLVKPTARREPVRVSFLASYTGDRGVNQFTKVQMNREADAVLQGYFREKAARILRWFSVIAPRGRGIACLRDELHVLAAKKWDDIHA